jgi:hypothetical protein
MAGDRALNNFDEPVDRVKSSMGGAATVFIGDLRVTSDVKKPDGSRAREHFLGAQGVARIGETGQNMIVGQTGIIGDDLRLAPALGHETDDEFDR